MPVLKPDALAHERVNAIAAFHDRLAQQRAEIDVSGGIDSAVLFALLVRALGAERVTAAFLGIHSSVAARDRAMAVAKALGARLVVDELDAEFDRRIEQMKARLVDAGYSGDEIGARLAADPTILGSIRSCMRAPLGRGYNRLTGGGIRHGTGNECEDRFLRFYQKGGDGEVDTNPIAMLSKGEVYQLALALKIPAEVLRATPSPDLWGVGEQHNDESELATWTGVAWTYSRVEDRSGEYTRVGTIERMSRYLDACRDALFRDEVSAADCLHGHGVTAALGHPAFGGLDEIAIEQLLVSAKRVEQLTRHKANPNIPTLGNRQELLEEGLLTDALPVL